MNDGVVLVLTRLEDSSADMVIGHLVASGAQVARFDPGVDFPEKATLSTVFADGSSWGYLAAPTRHINLKRVRAVYYRRPTPYRTGSTCQVERFSGTEARFGLGGVLASLPCPYLSHPLVLAEAEQKPLQLLVAQRVGFTVPATLITNQLDDARTFAAEYGPIIYKPVRGTSFMESNGSLCTIWTTAVDPADLNETVRHAPHLFQACVNKTADLRVTVVGEQIFCVQIHSDLLDWRADYDRISYAVIESPSDLSERCLSFLKAFRLRFGAFDFALTDDGPVFLECNPNGQWGWIEDHTGLPIAAAIADLLLKDSA
ncbi:ATP-grasp ribosomal peptide maturase [Nonomuraea sp. NEAU-A123]|uniref:ATP-grasp ribosomal peptide maturase n=1 Tax=Nonomuraea sp. NEAU-A123 TaxID=2839649 RepID=UPI001BE3E67F|nr:ATP-grasp ribosomal peptide maturase [Nonomuraea sp. NEAU-A123]MBT2228979.1 ATP-grasp ribosomal peptide maturase [Nonomuraea sp. NEAU-A123]